MVRLISRERGGLAAVKLTKLFGIDDFPAAKDSGKVLIIIIYCYLIIIIIILYSSTSVSKTDNLPWIDRFHRYQEKIFLLPLLNRHVNWKQCSGKTCKTLWCYGRLLNKVLLQVLGLCVYSDFTDYHYWTNKHQMKHFSFLML